MTALERIEDRPTWLLSRANTRAQRILGDAFAAVGVRGYHVRALAALDQHGPVSQADLGRHTGIDGSDVVATVNDLVERGLAARAPDPTDGRRNRVTITEPGTATLHELDGVLDAVQEAVLAPLDADERKALLSLLRKLSLPLDR